MANLSHSTNDLKVQPMDRRLTIGWLCIGAFAFSCLIANSLVPFLVWDIATPKYAEVIFFISSGVAVQVSSLGIVAAIGSGTATWRVLWTTVLAFSVGISFVFGLYLPEHGVPANVVLTIIGLALVGFLASTIVVKALSLIEGDRLEHSRYESNVRVAAPSTTIRYLLSVTTAVAVIVAATRAAATRLSTSETSQDFLEYLMPLIAYTILVSALVLSTGRVVMGVRRKQRVWLTHLAVIAAIVLFTVWLNHTLYYQDLLIEASSFWIGVQVFAAVFATVGRIAGWRITFRATDGKSDLVHDSHLARKDSEAPVSE